MAMGTVTGILVLKKKVQPHSQAVRIRIRVRLGFVDDMSMSESLWTSVMSRYGSEKDLPDQNFRQTEIFATARDKVDHMTCTQILPDPSFLVA